MVDAASIEAGIAVAETIIEEIIKVAPAITAGVASAEPYVEALAGIFSGSNVTQDQLDSLTASVLAASAQFQQPLPPDDGTTTT